MPNTTIANENPIGTLGGTEAIGLEFGGANFRTSPSQIATYYDGLIQSQFDVVSASGTWTKPTWAKTVEITAFGPGGPGGAGRRGAAASARSGGAGGAAGGRAFEKFLASELGATLAVVIGNVGTGAPAVAVNDTSGAFGNIGTNTTVTDGANTLLQAQPGSPGAGGTTAAAFTAAGVPVAFGVSNAGGGGSITAAGGAGSFNGNSNGPGGGAGGGTIDVANTPFAGGLGGFGYIISVTKRALGGAAGALAGGLGGAGQIKQWLRGLGGGGGGGGPGDAAGTIAGGKGGNGGTPGGGGGGGGASTNGANSGAGGDGGAGEVWFISYR